ncbi:hypothetical protein DFO56_104450 [Kosakonia sp. AG348]|nr:hypothetical protein DFO56_104450 [Kosakonia sp. AG348]
MGTDFFIFTVSALNNEAVIIAKVIPEIRINKKTHTESIEV